MKGKKFLGKGIAIAALLVLVITGLTGCDDYDDRWWGGPPYGYDYIDSRLTGYWALVQYNSEPVSSNEANYMYFNGNGYGRYYYLENGYRDTEELRYWCQDSNSGASNYQINIQYQYGSSSTMSYWFTHGGDTLWMQWQTGGGRVQTYVYDRINRAPW